MILGVDFLSSTESRIYLLNNSITFYDGMVDANLNKQSEVLLMTVNAVEIPPKSESIIPVSVPPFYKSQLSVVEPCSDQFKFKTTSTCESHCLSIEKTVQFAKS